VTHERPEALVVSPTLDLRLAVRRHLERDGWIVQEAENSHDCIARLTTLSFDLVAVDLESPLQASVAESAEIRSHRGRASLLGFVGTTSHTTREEVRAYGFDDVLSKPIVGLQLKACSRALLKRVKERT
jgi:DNA-binding response OmpR family regulator